MVLQREHYPELAERVRGQRTLQPDLYGDFDFERLPYRFTDDPAVESALPHWVADRATLLADDRLVELMGTATLLGDVAADPYASLVGEYGVPGLIEMLTRACAEGVESVAHAPPQLHTFIEAMAHRPDWLDMDLVEEGARHSRVRAAYLAPFITRGAFLGTFLNTYAALPMALTGALSGRRAAVRVNETSSFFAVTTLPGALERRGPGFRAAAMVRLMHSMVRYNALKRSDKWDVTVYGIPVPQVDQMPAGLIGMYLLASGALRKGRTEFTARERAMLEFGRYRCFLLGLPEELLPTTAEGIVRVFTGRGAVLREGFDDATCGALVRSTMAAYLRPGRTWFDRAAESVERSWSKNFFVRGFCGGDRIRAADMGVTLTRADQVRASITAPFILGRLAAFELAGRRAGLGAIADRRVVRTVGKRLADYGTPEFTTDARRYPTAL